MWRIQLLGGLRLEHGRTIIEKFRRQKTASLLAFMASHTGREFGREELIELFWPDDDLDAGRNNLRVALSELRRQLEPPPTPPGSVLATTRSHVRLRPEAFTTDVIAFEQALKRG